MCFTFVIALLRCVSHGFTLVLDSDAVLQHQSQVDDSVSPCASNEGKGELEMNRNLYQRQWRKQNKLLTDFLRTISSSESEHLNENQETDNLENACIEVSHDVEEDQSSEESASSDCEEIFQALEDCCVNNDQNNENISRSLVEWILRNKITRTASNELLSILRENGFEDVLPKCTRTLLQTPCNYEIKNKVFIVYLIIA